MFRFLRKSRPAKIPTSQRWLDATVRSEETLPHSWFHNSDMAGLIGRDRSWASICSGMISSVCATQRIRLFSTSKDSRTAKEIQYKAASNPANRRLKSVVFSEEHLAKSEFYEVSEHPVLDLLRFPCPYMDRVEFQEFSWLARCLAGNSFDEIVFKRGEPVALLPCLPQHIQVIASETEFIASYRYSRNEMDAVYFDGDEVLHRKFRPSVRNPYLGESPMRSVLAEMDIDAAAVEAEWALWRNGCRPDYMLKLPKDATPEQIDQAREMLQARFGGPANSGIPLLSPDIVVEPIRWNAKEMQYIEGQKLIAEKIWSAYGVPESLLRLNDSNLASSKVGHRQFLSQTIVPLLRKDAGALDKLLTYYDDTEDMFFAYDDPTAETQSEAESRISMLVRDSIMPPDQALKELGYEVTRGKTLNDVRSLTDLAAKYVAGEIQQSQAVTLALFIEPGLNPAQLESLFPKLENPNKLNSSETSESL